MGTTETDEPDLLEQFHADFGTDGNPLGRLEDTKAISGRYVAEIHTQTIKGKLRDDNDFDAVVTVWEPLDTPPDELDQLGDKFNEATYPKANQSWLKVLERDFSEIETGRTFYGGLDPETVEAERENANPEGEQ